MLPNELVSGMLVRIKNEWCLHYSDDPEIEEGYEEGEGIDYPEGWAPEMLNYCGRLVTIRHVGEVPEYIGNEKEFIVTIEEDGGQWSWRPIDFEIVLSQDDPNILFMSTKQLMSKPQ